MIVLAICTLMGALVGFVDPDFYLWVGALVGFVIGLCLLLVFKVNRSDSYMPEFDFGDD
jgi:hypothetical protein